MKRKKVVYTPKRRIGRRSPTIKHPKSAAGLSGSAPLRFWLYWGIFAIAIVAGGWILIDRLSKPRAVVPDNQYLEQVIGTLTANVSSTPAVPSSVTDSLTPKGKSSASPPPSVVDSLTAH